MKKPAQPKKRGRNRAGKGRLVRAAAVDASHFLSEFASDVSDEDDVETEDVPLDDDTWSAIMAAGLSQIHLQDVVAKSKSLLTALKTVSPIKAAAAFGGLLLQPQVQCSCLRLEVLVHLSVATARGVREPTLKLLADGFSKVGAACGYQEDPAEDTFVGNISSKRGNYLVLGGIWESATFYLQRLVNIADRLPDEPAAQRVVNAVYALLATSDFVCRRAGLVRNQLGHEYPVTRLNSKLIEQPEALIQSVSASVEELEAAGIDVDDLRPFFFDPRGRSELMSQTLGHTNLERRPLVGLEGRIYLVLPTAVSAAIRRYLLELFGSEANRTGFALQLSREYEELFDQTPLLGGRAGGVKFRHLTWGVVCSLRKEVDKGRWLVLTFVLDTLEVFGEAGLGGYYLGQGDMKSHFLETLQTAQAECEAAKGFGSGVSLVVWCGIGRSWIAPWPDESSRWENELISAPDLRTLSFVEAMEPLQLWRLFRTRRKLKELDVELPNINGLLNLFATFDVLGGNLVDEKAIPLKAAGSQIIYSLRQNALLDLRLEVLSTYDEHCEQWIDGRWRPVLVEERTQFEEDRKQPVYRAIDFGSGLPLAIVTLANGRPWWTCCEAPYADAGERWRMMSIWLARAAPVLEAKFGELLGTGSVLWDCTFTGDLRQLQASDVGGTAETAAESIDLQVDAPQRTVRMSIDLGFDRAQHHPDNVAEFELVKAFVRGTAALAEAEDIDLDELTWTIVRNREARQSHIFMAKDYRDYIRGLVNRRPLLVAPFDDGELKLGLAWKVRDLNAGGELRGKNECRSFLNALIARLEDELCEELRRFNRLEILSALMLNHEASSISRERWHRTAAANMALRVDQAAALKPLRDHDLKLNAVFQASRTLMEMALCESAAEGGSPLGKLDHALLMAKAAQIYHLGGWSDLIHYNLLEPYVVVRALGDVHVNHAFMDTVIVGFGAATTDLKYQDSVRRYPEYLKAPQNDSAIADGLDHEFLQACKVEFGVELDSYVAFIQAVEAWGFKTNSAFATIRQSQLEGLASDRATGRLILQNLTLRPRARWRDIPVGFDWKDASPWRFRRRLSILRRPLLCLSGEEDPQVLVAPGLLREAMAYVLGNYYEASYPDSHLGPAMRKYAGHARARDGSRFNAQVAEKMRELGWQVEPEVVIPKILGKSFERDYGDVDVLAWDLEKRRVLVIECKNLMFKKTYGEVAEQLTDFAGAMKADGKPDLLRKHLDRIQVLREHLNEVGRYVNATSGFSLESHVVFSNPVPMQHFDGPIRTECATHTLADLADI